MKSENVGSGKRRSDPRRELARTRRKARRDLARAVGGREAGHKRIDALSRLVHATLAEAALDFGRGTRNATRRRALGQRLRIATTEALGALAWAARPPTRRRLIRQLREVAFQDEEALQRGLAVAREGPRFSSRDVAGFADEKLEALLHAAERGADGEAIASYLATLGPMERYGCMRPYCPKLIALVGEQRIVGLFGDARDHTGIETACFFAPLVSARVRRPWLTKAVDDQIDHGDSDTLVHLVGCADLMTLRDGARLFVDSFGTTASADTSLDLVRLLRRGGDVYWMAPLLCRLGGDAALLAVAREIVTECNPLCNEVDNASAHSRQTGRKGVWARARSR